MQYIVQLRGDEVCPPDWCVEGVYSFWRFYYIRGGKATYRDEHRSFPLIPGTLYLFPEGYYYRMEHDAEQPLDVLWLHVCLFINPPTKPLEWRIQKDTLLHHLLQSLGMSMEISDSLLDKLFGALYEILYPELKKNDSRSDISKVCLYISDNLGRSCSNSQLAGMLGYTEKYFIRLFTKTVGIQPHKYVLNVRLCTAAKLLTQGMSVKETAGLLGYSSMTNFSRDFRIRYRVSPSDYAGSYIYRP